MNEYDYCLHCAKYRLYNITQNFRLLCKSSRNFAKNTHAFKHLYFHFICCEIVVAILSLCSEYTAMHVNLCIQAFVYVHIYVCSTRSTSCQLMHVTHTPCRNTIVLNIRIKYYCYFLNHIIPSLTHTHTELCAD